MVVGSIEAAPSIGEVSFVAGYITGRLADMGSPAATPPIRHARPDIMVAASIAVVLRIAAASTAGEASTAEVASTEAAEGLPTIVAAAVAGDSPSVT